MCKKAICLLAAFAMTLFAVVPAFAQSAYSGGKHTFKLAHHINDAHYSSELAKDFAAEADKLSGGAIKIEVYGNSQLGTQAENAEAVRLGTIDFALNDYPTIGTVYPMAEVVALPYLFKSYDHVNTFFNSDRMARMVDDIAAATGVRIIGPSYDSFRFIFSKDKVTKLEDMKGMKIRVPDIPLYVSTFKAMGCATTIVAYSEMYTALQTGVVTALENNSVAVYTGTLYEQVKYAAETNHIFTDQSIMMNEELFQGLDEAAKKVILDAAKAAAMTHRQRVVDSLDKYKALLVEKGMEFTAVDTEPFRKICQPVWEQYTSKVEGGQELIDYIQGLAK